MVFENLCMTKVILKFQATTIFAPTNPPKKLGHNINKK